MANPIRQGWKKGQSGNPKGRPPNPESITNLLRELGDTPAEGKKTKAQLLAEKLWAMALKKNPNPRCMEYVIDRLEGKPRERHEVSSTDQGFLVIVRSEKKNDSNSDSK